MTKRALFLTTVVIGLAFWLHACSNLNDLTPPSCAYTVTPSPSQFDGRGGTGTLAIQTPGSCPWTVTNSSSWITLTGSAAGKGNGSVGFSVAANPGADLRNAALDVSGHTITLSQTGSIGGSDCTYTLSPNAIAVGTAGMSGAVSVATSSSCGWTAVSLQSWITISSGGSGIGNGSIQLTVAPNNNPGVREGIIEAAGQLITFTQQGTQSETCTYSLAPPTASFTAAGGSGSVALATQAGCTWTAVEQAAWIDISSSPQGTGNGAITYTVAANAAGARTSTITAGGQAVTINQAANPCTFSVSPTSANFNDSDGNGTINVTTQAGCAWTAVEQASWVTITSGASGTGNGQVRYAVARNQSNNPRTTTITVAGQMVTINQAAKPPDPCTYDIQPTAATFSAAGGGGTVNLTTAGGCAWTATSQASWITITAGDTGTGTGQVKYLVAVNTTLANRVGTLTVAAQTVTITQFAVVPAPVSGEILTRGPVNTGWWLCDGGVVLAACGSRVASLSHQSHASGAFSRSRSWPSACPRATNRMT